MIDISCEDVGKQYQYKWVLQGFSHTFLAGSNYVIAGKNGSGKSTLLKMLSAYLSPSKGSISWHNMQHKLEKEEVYLHACLTGPYVEVPEEFTFPELIRLQRHFKRMPSGLSPEKILKLSGLERFADTPIKNFSSGMKQRAKLALSIFPEAGLLLLDEPCTNLDANAREWYQHILHDFSKDKTVIVASNHHLDEYPGKHSLISL